MVKILKRENRCLRGIVEVVEVLICDGQETGKGLIFPRLGENTTGPGTECFLLITLGDSPAHSHVR